MGIFQNLFGKESRETPKEENPVPWIPLNTVAQLDEISTKSKTKTQLIFKHSTTCGISRMVLKMFTDGYPISENEADIYFLDLHKFREVSSKVAQKFNVQHQSPQLLVIKNGIVVAHTSHGSIPDLDLRKYV